MNSWKLFAAAGIIAISADKGQLALEQKEVLTLGYDTSTVEITSSENVPFDIALLEELVEGKDIIPGFPEQGAMCAKTMRALVNTLLGETYFAQNRFLSKVEYKLQGKETLLADKAGVSGDSWEMFYRIQNAGGLLLYFTEEPIIEQKTSIDFVIQHAQIGDLIGFYYPDSKYNEIAHNAGPGFTHMGLVVGYAKNGEVNNQKVPLIAHLFHSDQYFDKRKESEAEYVRKELLSFVYGVDHNTIPAFRVDMITNLESSLIFQEYKIPQKKDNVRKEPEYRNGDPLLYVKAVLRPKYR